MLIRTRAAIMLRPRLLLIFGTAMVKIRTPLASSSPTSLPLMNSEVLAEPRSEAESRGGELARVTSAVVSIGGSGASKAGGVYGKETAFFTS